MLHTYAHVHVSYVRTYIHTWLEYEEYSTCHNNISVDAKASLGASLRELASCCSEAAVHSSSAQIPQRRRSTEHECSNAQNKARMRRIYGLPGLYTKRITVLRVPCIRVVCPSS